MYSLAQRSVRGVAWAIACLMLTALTQYSAAQTNLALNKPTKASSQAKPEQSSDKAVDGITLKPPRYTWYTATRWTSSRAVDRDTAWFMVNLQSVHKLNKVVIKWEYAFARSFDILVSKDNKAWTLAKHVAWSTCFQNGSDGVETVYFEPIDAHYVKFQGISRGTPYAYSIYEFEVYENADMPAELPDFSYPGPEAAFTIDGRYNPCEVINTVADNVGPVEYAPWMFHNKANYVRSLPDGTNKVTFPGGTKVKWTYEWKMKNAMIDPINGMAGLRYGLGGRGSCGGAPIDAKSILPLPMTVDIFTTWKCDYTVVSGSHTVAYDMWTTNAAGDTTLDEIMIFFDTGGRFIKNKEFGGYAGTPWATPTIGGIKWEVFGDVGSRTKSFGPADNQPIYEFSGNLKDFFDFLRANDRLLGTHLEWMWCGVETGGRNTDDIVEGKLTTTEWSISSPGAHPVANRDSFRPVRTSAAAQHTKPAQLVPAVRGYDSFVNQRASRDIYSIRGELIASSAGGRTPNSSAVRILR